MQRISRAHFVERFPLVVPAWKIKGIESGPFRLDADAEVSGILHGGLTISAGAKALVHGIVEGPLVVESDAVLYFDGIVKGDVQVDGAACLDGIIDGAVSTNGSSVIALDAMVSRAKDKPRS